MASSPMGRKRCKFTRTPQKIADSSVTEKPIADAQAAGEIKAVPEQEAKAAEVEHTVTHKPTADAQAAGEIEAVPDQEAKAAEVERAVNEDDKTAGVDHTTSNEVKTIEDEPAANQQVITTEITVNDEIEIAKVEPAVFQEVKVAEAKAAINNGVKTVEVERSLSHDTETAKVGPVISSKVDPNHELNTTEAQRGLSHEVKTTADEAPIAREVKTSKIKPALKPTTGVSPGDCASAAKNGESCRTPSGVQSTIRGDPGDKTSVVGAFKRPSKTRIPPKNGTKAKTAVLSGRSAFEVFKSGEPDPPVVADMLRRLEASKQSNAAAQKKKMNENPNVEPKPIAAGSDILSGIKSSGRGAKKGCPRKHAHSPVDENEDGDIGEEFLEHFGTNICRDGQWWVEPIIGEAFPKRPEYSTWCQAGTECLGLRDFHCLLRHEYQDDFWFARKANLGSLPVDPEGLGSRDPPYKHDDKPLVAPSRFPQYTGHIRGAATGRDWAKAKGGSRYRKR